jgi:ribosomal protein S18 acetylase RimI-like enzyme
MVNNVGAHPGQHRQGVGTSLVVHVERTLRSEGEERARVLIVETSSGDAYETARAFYARRGFHPEAVIREFYGLGEDKIVFWQSWFEANRSAVRCSS